MSSKHVSYAQESENYFWYHYDKLGQGATGQVFKCKEKQSGLEYASKVFNGHGMSRPNYVSQRELDVLTKLKKCTHENIVRVMAIEQEKHTGYHAIIMELCVESLQMVIEKPENSFGFEEEEFIQVVHDVVSGMKYLNDEKVIHRDIKPANILRYVKDDGSSVYKLTDFGAARELDPEANYTSIYGTEEYLHPDMYEKGVMKKDAGKKFGASTDLWSLGVTFYHIATGKLPFRPYGGRLGHGRETMFQITTTKKSGIISGIQKSENGEIEWSDKLPENTRLSLGLKEQLVVILARLFESDPQKEMNFDEFFQVMEHFLNMTVIHVYNTRSGTFHTIYANPEDNFARFQELIAIQTSVSARQQDLFHNSVVFKPHNSMAKVSTYPKTTKEKPIIVLGGDTAFSEKVAAQSLFKEIQFKHDVSLSNLESDFTVAKMFAKQVHWCVYATTNSELSRSLTMEAAQNVIILLKRKARKYLNDAQTIDSHCHSVITKHETCLKGCEFEMNVMQTLIGSDKGDIPQELIKEKEHLVKETKDMREKVNKLQQDMTAPLENLRKRSHGFIFGDGELAEKWRKMNEHISNENYVGIAQNFTGKICDIMSNFLQRKFNSKSMTTQDLKIQQYERCRLVEYCTKVTNAMEACQARTQTVHENLRVWLDDVYECRSSLKKSHAEVQSYIEMFDAVIESEEKWRTDHIMRMENLVKGMRTQLRRAISIPEEQQAASENITDHDNESLANDEETDITTIIQTISSETQEAKLSLQENTENFQKFVQGLMEELKATTITESDV